MTQAITTAYVLLRITNKLQQPFNGNIQFNNSIDELKTDSDFEQCISHIENLEIIVIGSGGTPNLFTNQIDFIEYYKRLNSYIHFTTEVFVDDRLKYIDPFTYDIEVRLNRKLIVFNNFLMCLLKSYYVLNENVNVELINMFNSKDKSKRHDYMTMPQFEFPHEIQFYVNVLKKLINSKVKQTESLDVLLQKILGNKINEYINSDKYKKNILENYNIEKERIIEIFHEFLTDDEIIYNDEDIIQLNFFSKLINLFDEISKNFSDWRSIDNIIYGAIGFKQNELIKPETQFKKMLQIWFNEYKEKMTKDSNKMFKEKVLSYIFNNETRESMNI
jgi:hypothetical protein